MILFIIFLNSCSNNDIYGNTDAEILKYLQESDLLDNIGKDNIFINDIINIDNSKIVGFSTDTGQGVLVYDKDKNGNYVMSEGKAEGRNLDSIGVAIYRVMYNIYESFQDGKHAYVVLSTGDNISKVEIIINNKYKYSESIEIGKPSMTMIKEDIPRDESKSMEIDYKYFDINGKELSDEHYKGENK